MAEGVIGRATEDWSWTGALAADLAEPDGAWAGGALVGGVWADMAALRAEATGAASRSALAAPVKDGGAQANILGPGGLPGTGSSEPEYISFLSNGDAANRIDIWFAADGYTAADRDALLADVSKQMSYLFGNGLADPFGRYADFFNVHIVFPESAERGADRPEEGIYVDTALNASYSWDGGVTRCLYFDTGLAFAAVDAVRPDGVDADMFFGVVNSDVYGGCGGSWAVYSAGVGSAGDLALHEIGHSYAELDDEYWTSGETHQGGEPSGANVTIDPTGAKWAHWLGFDDGVLGPIGAYEGGYYAEFGVYRPTMNSKMRSLGQPFDAIAKEAFILRFYEEVDPLDGWAFEDIRTLTGTLSDEYGFWIDTISDSVIEQEWSLNGEIIEGATGTTLSLGALGLAPGTYTLTARAYDDTDLVRLETGLLEQTVSWDVQLSYWAADGTAARDVMAGQGRDDRLDGFAGNDVLSGLGGDDLLIGGAGSDILEGGAGADVIYGDGMV